MVDLDACVIAVIYSSRTGSTQMTDMALTNIHSNTQHTQERLRKEAVQSAGHFTDALAETLSNR